LPAFTYTLNRLCIGIIRWRENNANNPDEIVKHIAGFQQSLDKLSSLIEEGKAKEIEHLLLAGNH
jgi:prephenate dehydrogenase